MVFFFLLHLKRNPLLPMPLTSRTCTVKEILHESHGILIWRHTFFLLCITCFVHFHWVSGSAVFANVDFSRNGSELSDGMRQPERCFPCNAFSGYIHFSCACVSSVCQPCDIGQHWHFVNFCSKDYCIGYISMVKT